MHPTGTNPYLFNGKVAIVTGGTSGIGKEIVVAFARAGALVCYCGRHEDIGIDQAKELRKEGLRVEFVKADITSESEVSKFITQTKERHGNIDFVVNNAGLESDPHPISETSLEDFNRVIATNLTGTFLVLKAALPIMKTSGGGAVVNIASVLGEIGMPLIAPFVAAKHAVIGLTKSAALEEAPHKIRVNAVAPGAVNTDMLYRTMHDSEATLEHIKRLHPLGRIAEPSDVAEAVLWLCSDASSFVTGQVINVDGGYTVQ
jgi:NAD(P)-dependent dehydrogenase (short-subunit alcohol dehydrogenase family)